MPSSATGDDRKAAAIAMITDHPTWSDRVIAERTGISARAVAAMRDADDAPYRIGRDGRHRPRDPIAGRRRAAELLHTDGDLTLKAMAEAAGIAVATAKDVRDRVSRGVDPVPESLRRRARAEGEDPSSGNAPRARSGSPLPVALPLEEALGNAVDALAGSQDSPAPRPAQRREAIVALAIRCSRLCEEFVAALS